MNIRTLLKVLYVLYFIKREEEEPQPLVVGQCNELYLYSGRWVLYLGSRDQTAPKVALKMSSTSILLLFRTETSSLMYKAIAHYLFISIWWESVCPQDILFPMQ